MYNEMLYLPPIHLPHETADTVLFYFMSFIFHDPQNPINVVNISMTVAPTTATWEAYQNPKREQISSAHYPLLLSEV